MRLLAALAILLAVSACKQALEPPRAGLETMPRSPMLEMLPPTPDVDAYEPSCEPIAILPHLDRYDCHIRKALMHHAAGMISPENIKAQIEVESDGDMDAVSRAGALCAMQLLPGTFNDMLPGGDIKDPEDCVRAGVKYRAWGARFWLEHLRSEEERWGPLSELVYNAGPKGGLDAQGKCGGYTWADFGPCAPLETRNYIVRIEGLASGKPRAFWLHPGLR